ncbi:MAG: tetratricopeptide repeat protein [Capsulimonadaceae bacterium]
MSRKSKSQRSTETRTTPIPESSRNGADLGKPGGGPPPLRIPAVIIVIVALVFQDVRTFDFLTWDDQMNFTNNPHLNGLTPVDVGYFWTHIYRDTYRPMVFTLWGLVQPAAHLAHPIVRKVLGTYQIDPHVFHTLNIALHAVNAVLVFLLLHRLLRRVSNSPDLPAAIGGLFFALHPIQDEAVAWATAANELLFGLFSLLSLIFFVESLSEPTPARSGSPPLPKGKGEEAEPSRRQGSAPLGARASAALAFVCYVAALFTKPTAVALPLVAWCVGYWALGRTARDCTRTLAVWVLPAIAWVAVTLMARHIEGAAPHEAIPLRFIVAGNAVDFYLWKLIWPTGLTIDYGRTPAYILAQRWAWGAWLLPPALIAVLWRVHRRFPMPAAACGMFVCALLPVMGFIPNTFQIYSTESDRYMYLPMAGVALAVAWAVDRAAADQRRRIPVLAASVCLLGLYAGLTIRRLPDYRDNAHLYSSVLRVNPRSWMAHVNLGLEYFEEGRETEAIAQTQQAIAMGQNDPTFQFDLGEQLDAAGRYAEAAAAFADAFARKHDIANAEYNEGFALGQAGQYEQAIDVLRDVVRREPANMTAYDQLGANLVKARRLTDAATVWQTAQSVNPQYTNAHYNLGAVYLMQNHPADAMAQFQAALAIDPANAQSQAALAQAQRMMPRGK